MQTFWKKLKRSSGEHTQRFHRWRKHPAGAAIGAFGLLVLVGGVLLFVLTKQQTATFHPDTSFIAIISHDHSLQTVPTNEPTVGALLKKLSIHIGAMDRVEPSVATPIDQDNFRINVYRATPVTIYDGTTTTTTFSAAGTPRSIVTEAGVPLYAEDRATARPAENLVSEQSLGENIIIERSTPVTLNVYGTVLATRTRAKTVAALLREKNIKLNAKDTVVPAVTTPISNASQVLVVRNGIQIITATQAITPPIQTVTDASLSFGTSAVRQQGTPGTEILTYQVDTEKGVEVSRTLLQTVVTTQPVPTIVAQGQAVSIPADKQAVMAQAGIAASDYAYVDYIASHEGGWCPTKIQGHHDCPGYMTASSVPSYGGYGIFQATPGGKMASAGSDWVTSAVTQIRWATGYADGRYGSWAGAYNHWASHHNW